MIITIIRDKKYENMTIQSILVKVIHKILLVSFSVAYKGAGTVSKVWGNNFFDVPAIFSLYPPDGGHVHDVPFRRSLKTFFLRSRPISVSSALEGHTTVRYIVVALTKIGLPAIFTILNITIKYRTAYLKKMQSTVNTALSAHESQHIFMTFT